MKIATWNVNSVRKRTGNLVSWLQRGQARRRRAAGDQGAGAAVPHELEVEAAGYKVRDRRPEGLQRRRPPLAASVRRHGARPARPCRGRAGALCRGPRVHAARAADRRRPLSAQRQSDRHREVHLQDRLDGAAARPRAASCWRREEMFVLCGDYNVCPTDMDVYDPEGLRQRRALPAGVARGAAQAAQSRPDRRRARLPSRRRRNTPSGITRPAPGRRTTACASTTCCSRRRPPTACTAVGIDKAERGKPEPSDHVPVWCELDVAA